MNFHWLPKILLALLLLPLSGCASLGAGLPPGLGDALGQITGLSTNIADWQSNLGSMLDGTGLGQLKEYADQAGNLGRTLTDMQSGLSDAMADPIGAIGSKLGDMSGIDIEGLKGLAPQAQMDRVSQFTDNAKGVGSMATDFLQQFSK